MLTDECETIENKNQIEIKQKNLKTEFKTNLINKEDKEDKSVDN